MKIFISELLASLGLAFFMVDLLSSLVFLCIAYLWIRIL